MGHHSLEVTQRYAHTTLDRARAAIAKLSVGAALGSSLLGCTAPSIEPEPEPQERINIMARLEAHPDAMTRVEANCPDDTVIVTGGCIWGGYRGSIVPVTSAPMVPMQDGEPIEDAPVQAWICTGWNQDPELVGTITALAICVEH